MNNTRCILDAFGPFPPHATKVRHSSGRSFLDRYIRKWRLKPGQKVIKLQIQHIAYTVHFVDLDFGGFCVLRSPHRTMRDLDMQDDNRA